MATYSIVSQSSLERTQRIDAEFYSPVFRDLDQNMSGLGAKRLTEHASVSDGNHASISRHFGALGVRYLRGQDINDFFIGSATPVCLPDEVFNSTLMHRSHMKPLDVLVSIVGTIGSVALVPEGTTKLTGSCKIAIVRSKGLNPYYLAAFLLSRFGQAQISRLKRGALQMGLTLEDFDQIRVPECPREVVHLVEQRVRMAQEQRSLAEASFDGAVTQGLKLLNLSVGKGDSRRTVIPSASVVESQRLDPEYYCGRGVASLAGQLASSGGVLADICDRIASGVTPSKHEYAASGVPILKVEGLDSVGVAETTDGYVPASWAASKPKGEVRKGDILVLGAAHAASYIGKAGLVVNELPDNCRVVAELINVRVRAGISPEAVVMYLNLPPVRRHLQSLIRGSTAHLYPRDMRELPIPSFDHELTSALQEGFLASQQRQESARALLQEAIQTVEDALMGAIG